MNRFAKKAAHVPPDGAIRKSQMITTFGPGSMVDLVDQAVLIGGLDYWEFAKGWKPIPEPRLRDVLADKLRKANRGELSVDRPFREPPRCDDKAAARNAGVQALEFPQWFVCQNPQCRALVRARDGLERKSGRCYHQCTSGKASLSVPVRFVGACGRGHLQDWPWIRFAHQHHAEGTCHAPELELHEGATGDFSEIQVVCRTCRAHQKLSAATAQHGAMLCDGTQPWLGGEEREECDQTSLRLLVRTASNSYFAQVESAISIPDQSRDLDDAVSSVWKQVKDAEAADLPMLRRVIGEVREALERWSDADVLKAIEARKSGRTLAVGSLRAAEFRQFISQPEERPGDGPEPEMSFFARRLPVKEGELPPQVEAVVLAHKLREVRAQIGFTRLEPITPDLEGEYGVEELRIRAAPLGTPSIDWLPAIEILGEGIFIRLREDEVAAWERRKAVEARQEELQAGYEAWRQCLKTPAPDFPGARFYLLHSLSHLLINAVSLDCGYPASSIRERIYCGPAGPKAMAGILLSTGTPGAEGTLGGLIEQAKRLREHLRRAYDLGTLCSNDPVCGSHSPEDDRAERYLEGAACHGCLFVAECSCERFNNFLDRGLVVPTIGQDPELAFFQQRP